MFTVENSQPVDIQQGTDDWRAWREDLYTASDAPAVMGKSPWFPKTPLDLWKRKTGQQSVHVNSAMIAGQVDEHLAREDLQLQINSLVVPMCWQAKVNGMSWGASYDGYSEERAEIFEIKRPSRGSASILWEGQSPGHYFWQMLHQLICNPNAARCSLVVYAHDLKKIKIAASVSRSDSNFDEAASALVAAWAEYDAAINSLIPPPATDGDVIEVLDEEFAELARAWLVAKAAADAADADLEIKRKNLIDAARTRGNNSPVSGGGIRAYRVVRPGNVNWKSKEIVGALEAAKIDVEKYRGKPIESWTIKGA